MTVALTLMVIEPLSHGICVLTVLSVESGLTVNNNSCWDYESWLFSFPMVVEEILGEFREQFISDMDVIMVVMELFDKDIISDGVQESIEKADGRRRRSEILHEYLKRTCTEEAFRTVCGIIASVRGSPKMSALGKDMQRRLESGGCVCMSIRISFILATYSYLALYPCVCRCV